MSDNASRQRIIIIAAVTAGLLLLANVFLLMNKAKSDKKNKELTEQLSESDQLKLELEKQYYESLSELEELKGNNEELNALIDEQKAQLEEQKITIEGYLGDRSKLRTARSEIAKLRNQAKEYIAQITQLQEENADLKDQTARLSSKNDSLYSSLVEKSAEASRLSTAKAALTSENESLTAEKSRLSSKVDVASVIDVENVVINGYKTRKNGKPTQKKQAKNIEYLQICFTATANRVARADTELFQIRIVTPTGETVADDALGSGELVSQETGNSIRYTKETDLEYDQSENSLCTNWNTSTPLTKGKYAVEVYNKGYLSGTGSFELK